MPAIPNLPELKNRLQNLVADNKGMVAIDELLQLLPEGSPKHQLLLGLKASLKELKSNVMGMQLSFEESSRFHARYNKQLLDFITDLETDDFDPNIRRSQLNDTQKIRRGHVLYRVAKEMQLEKEYRCLVRIAFDEEMVLEDLELDDDTSLKSGIRISKYMRVEIKDPSAAGVFDIRSTSEPVQLIDDDDYTEWRFYVKPLLPGEHILELTVTIMQRIDGQDRVREKTLEESVVIITEAPAQEEEPVWKKDNEQLTMAAVVDAFVPQPVQSPAAPSPSPASPRKRGGYLRGAALSLALLMTVTATYAFGPEGFREQVDWVNTYYIQDSETSYNKFLESYPESERKETATFKRAKAIQRDDSAQPERAEKAMVLYLEVFGDEAQYADEALWTIAELSDLPEDYNTYLQRKGEHPMDEAARAAISRLEPQFWKAIISQPNVLQLDRYLRLYPQGEYRSTALQLLADSSNWHRSTRLPARILKDTTDWQRRIQQYIAEATAEDENLGEAIQRCSQQSTIQSSVYIAATKNGITNEAPQIDASTIVNEQLDTEQEEIQSTPAEQTTTGNDEEPTIDSHLIQTENDTEVKEITASALAEIADNMVHVTGGTFTMGCKDEVRDGDCYEKEHPAHEVTLSSFSISKYEVTQVQWRAVMGTDPPELNNRGCDQCPVEGVSWNDIQDFLNRLNRTSSRKYRLPTEAEWEYAARGGGKSMSYFYSGSNNIGKVAWYDGNAKHGNTHGSEKNTRPVGGKLNNELGLFDMSGNVWEWVEDDYNENYNGAPLDGSVWLGSPRGSNRVFRGGGWDYPARACRVAYRNYWRPTLRHHDIGFRLVHS